MNSFVVAKVLIENSEGKVLLLKRSETDVRRPLTWDLVGGWVDSGEDILEALKREAKEEAGITLNSPKLVFTHMEPEDQRGVGNWLLFVDKLSAQQTVKLSYEHSEFAWFDKKDLKSAIERPLYKELVEHIQKYDLWI